MERETGLIREGGDLVQLRSPALSIAFQQLVTTTFPQSRLELFS
jgi:hypothetical protein